MRDLVDVLTEHDVVELAEVTEAVLAGHHRELAESLPAGGVQVRSVSLVGAPPVVRIELRLDDGSTLTFVPSDGYVGEQVLGRCALARSQGLEVALDRLVPGEDGTATVGLRIGTAAWSLPAEWVQLRMAD